jgi:hypothetical protein
MRVSDSARSGLAKAARSAALGAWFPTVRKPAVRSRGGQRRAESPHQSSSPSPSSAASQHVPAGPMAGLLLKWVEESSGGRVHPFVLLPNLESMRNWRLQPHVFPIECSPSTGCCPDLVQMHARPLRISDSARSGRAKAARDAASRRWVDRPTGADRPHSRARGFAWMGSVFWLSSIYRGCRRLFGLLGLPLAGSTFSSFPPWRLPS